MHLDLLLKQSSVPLTCSKCGSTFAENSEFHGHILQCGGLSPWDRSPSKRRRKRKGHGGGLKSTVRMLKKSSQSSRDGTDTGKGVPS